MITVATALAVLAFGWIGAGRAEDFPNSLRR